MTALPCTVDQSLVDWAMSTQRHCHTHSHDALAIFRNISLCESAARSCCLATKVDVRFTPESGHLQCTSSCPLSANSGHPKLVVALSRISDKYRRARQGDDDFGELAGLRIDVD
jgi:hypothetical protein